MGLRLSSVDEPKLPHRRETHVRWVESFVVETGLLLLKSLTQRCSYTSRERNTLVGISVRVARKSTTAGRLNAAVSTKQCRKPPLWELAEANLNETADCGGHGVRVSALETPAACAVVAPVAAVF